MNMPLKPAMPGLDQLSSLQLPTLPAGTPYLLKSLTNENINFVELAAIVEKFPSIASKLISLANSAWSAPTTPVTSLEVTCSRLGLGVVKSTSLALAIASPFNLSKCSSFDAGYFWCGALLAADAASRLASISSSNDVEPSTARAAGLLHNLAVLWLVDQLPVEVDESLTRSANDQDLPLHQALIDVLGFNHMQAGERLGQSLDLPEPLVAAMAFYSDPNYLGAHSGIVTIVGLAVKMVSAVLKQAPCPEQDVCLSDPGLTQHQLTRVFDEVSEQLVKTQIIAKLLI